MNYEFEITNYEVVACSSFFLYFYGTYLQAMAKVIIDPNYLTQLAALDAEIRVLNVEKIKLLFKVLDISLTTVDFEKLMGWELVLVTVPDKQMAVQLNKLAPIYPTLSLPLTRHSRYLR